MSTGRAPHAEATSRETVLGRLAGLSYDHRRLVLGLWIVVLVGITVLSQLVGTTFKNKFTAGNTPSQQAQDILQAKFPGRSGDTADVVFRTATPIVQNRAAIESVVSSLEGLPYVQSVASPFSPGAAHQIAA